MSGDAEQSRKAQEVAAMPLEAVIARVETLVEAAHGPHISESREEALHELLALHERLRRDAPDQMQRAEQAFILTLRGQPTILENEQFRHFVAHYVDPSDFHDLSWNNAEEVIAVAEVLYAIRFGQELSPVRVSEIVGALVRDALRHFEEGGDSKRDEMFELVARAPIPAAHMDAELRRLRSRMHIYEQRRYEWRRRLVLRTLFVQALLVFLIFPLLFQNFENGSIQREVEGTEGFAVHQGEIVCTDEVQDIDCHPPFQFLSFGDSLYWSIITYASIGYGDITPVTPQGKTMAAIHGLMGVLTTGLVAGLVLRWLTPREIE